MNGAFKFKENLFLKYKKEISLIAGAVLTLTTVVRYVPVAAETSPVAKTEEAGPEVVEIIEPKGVMVSYNGQELGIVASEAEAQAAAEEALVLAQAELGYDPEVVMDLEMEDNYGENPQFISVETLAADMKADLIEGLDEVKIKAYVMKIGDDFTVALSCADDIKEVLMNAQTMYMNADDMALDIELAKDDHNSLVFKPQVTMIKEEASKVTRSFTASSGDGEDVTAEGDAEAPAEPEEEKDERFDGETVAIDFAEEVMIVETYVYEDEIEEVQEATALITKENDEPKVYEVRKGDVPSIIAERNDMKLSELYNMNPNLKGNERSLQIGDTLIVMVPEPELSVATEEEVVYQEPISKGVTYVDNPDKYEGAESVIDNGSDGVLEVTALVSKINGDVIGKIITEETIIKEPQDKVISKGSKPLPAKGATGNYISPLSSYSLTSPFGYRWGGFHYGVDLAASSGTPVMAADGGRVTIAGWQGAYGYLVEIDHGNGVRTRYGHNSVINVKVGQQVAQYEVIAKVGSTGRSTGPHVHFEIRFDGVCANPADYVDF